MLATKAVNVPKIVIPAVAALVINIPICLDKLKGQNEEKTEE